MNAEKIASKNKTLKIKTLKNMTLGLAALAGLSLAAGAASADDPTTMAPPIDGVSAPLGTGNAGVNASADSVFNWQEIPAGQQVPLSRATFDQGGYQLYDTVGETIVVPFTNQNLYVMKFAESPNGNLFFENEGGFPVLYVPKGGFLENATIAGARWFPLGENFHPTEPVFLGIAPSYTDFVDLGWYPDTFFYGGYYGHSSFVEGSVFLPTVGLFFSIGGHPYYGWNSYHDYYREHPGFSHVGYYNRDFYHFAGNHYRTFAPDRHFGGYAGGGYNHGFGGGDHHGFGGDHNYRGGEYASHGGFAGQSGYGRLSGRTFRGAGGYAQGGRSYSVNNAGDYSHGGQHFGGQNYGGQNYGGRQNYGGQNYGGRQNDSSGRSFRGASNYGGGQSYGGGRSYGGGSSSYSGRSFGGNSGGASSYSGRSFGGGSSGRSSGGGQQSRTASNSGGSRGSDGGGRSFGGSRGGDGGGRR